jgi:hypothetical protein
MLLVLCRASVLGSTEMKIIHSIITIVFVMEQAWCYAHVVGAMASTRPSLHAMASTVSGSIRPSRTRHLGISH